MPTTRFSDSLRVIADENPNFARELLEDAVNALLMGELDEGRVLLRNYINATIGFSELGRRTGRLDKNLMRSLGPKGSPTAANLFDIIQVCLDAEGAAISAQIIPKRDDRSQITRNAV